VKTVSNPKKAKNDTEKTRWAKFTYVGKETRAITKIFKGTDIKIAFSTRNTLGRHLTRKHNPPKGKFEQSGIYQLTCPTCDMKYTGQTGRSFKTRFREHQRVFKHGNGNSSFAQHVLDNRHDFGTMENIMNPIHIIEKGRLMDTIEKYSIFCETKLCNQINDKLTVKPNVIFETVIREDPHRGIPNVYPTGENLLPPTTPV
jgi:hypothetical protein